jgi:hypothetical protein
LQDTNIIIFEESIHCKFNLRKIQIKFVVVLVIAIVSGIAIAWVDTRPHWNDTGITVSLLALVSLVCGYFASKKPLLVALAVGLWVPVFNIVLTGNFSVSAVLVFTFAGAYAGYFIKKKT